MSVDSKTFVEEGAPRYLVSGDPGLADYYPAWVDNLADDATVEGSMLDGAVQGAEGVRTIVTTIRAEYGDSQEFHFTGPWGDNGWLEDYIARIDDKPLGCVVLVTRNKDEELMVAHKGALLWRAWLAHLRPSSAKATLAGPLETPGGKKAEPWDS